MPRMLRTGRGWFVFALLLGVVLAWWSIHAGWWGQLLAGAFRWQYAFNQKLVAAIEAARDGGVAAARGVIAISFLYGVFHAVGPGHGKAVMATYLGTTAATLRRGVVLSFAASLMQGVTAISIVILGSWLFSQSMHVVMGASAPVELASFGFVALLGVFLMVRSTLRLMRLHRSAAGGAHQASATCSCGHEHGPAREQIEHPLDWHVAASVILGIGLRPCTGAILVLLAAAAIGISYIGIAAVLAMSVGTGMTVCAVALLAASGRQALVRAFPARSASRSATLGIWLGLAGGMLLLLLGTLLMIGTLAAPTVSRVPLL